MKKITSERNNVGGIDLITERDSGNEIRILTGNKKNSLKYWKTLAMLAETVINELEIKEK
jgi:hypothetical protein